MKIFTVVSTLLVALGVASASDLQIETTYMPENCDIKSRKGDLLSMQYVLEGVDWAPIN
jgi:hypothetical protein